MPETVSRYWDWLGSAADPSVRNLVALLVCIAVYSAFLSRGRDKAYGRTRRPQRCADSVLRGGGD